MLIGWRYTHYNCEISFNSDKKPTDKQLILPVGFFLGIINLC